MQALYVHGMGRSPLSAWPSLRHLRQHGVTTRVFGYIATVQSFATIRDRLVQVLLRVAEQGEYVVIGHSLGGVLLRAALAELPPGTTLPQQIFLLASPIQPSRLAQQFRPRWLFRLATGDCGQLLASPERMAAVPISPVPCTAIVGVGGPQGRLSAFPGEPNDGIVSLREVSADWLTEIIPLPLMHTLMPAKRQVAEMVLARLRLSS